MAEMIDESTWGRILIRVNVKRTGAIESQSEIREAPVLLLGAVACNLGKDRLHTLWNEAMKEAGW